MEYRVSPDFTLWRSTLACSGPSSSDAFTEVLADLAAEPLTLSGCAAFGERLLGLPGEAEANSLAGETGRCKASTVRPCRLSPRNPFQRRTICSDTPKFSATVCTVSPLRTL